MRKNIVQHKSITNFTKVYSLNCFFQRHVSALLINHFQVDYFFLSKAKYKISNAIVIVSYEISYNIYKALCFMFL